MRRVALGGYSLGLLLWCSCLAASSNQFQDDKGYSDADGCSSDTVTFKSNMPTSSSKGCRPFRPHGPDDPSVFVVTPNGRLGNHLVAYAVLLYCRIFMGVDAYIARETKTYMRKVFVPSSLEIPALEDEFCDWATIRMKDYRGTLKALFTDQAWRRGEVLWLLRKCREWPQGLSIPDHMCKEVFSALSWSTRRMRSRLRFPRFVVRRVAEAKAEVAAEMGLAVADVIFVAVHSRRTDGEVAFKRDFGYEPITAEFYIKAMDFYRQNYKNVAFLFVSDDMDWGRRNLGGHKDLFFVGDGDPDDDDAIAFDFAVIAKSNHTIMSRGSFSQWAASLGEGYTYSEEFGFVPPF